MIIVVRITPIPTTRKNSPNKNRSKEAIDKASITLGINQRHAKTEINANATNAIQINRSSI